MRGSSPRMTRLVVVLPERSAARSSCVPVRCRAEAVAGAGVWYGPGSAERHKNAAPRPGHGSIRLLRQPEMVDHLALRVRDLDDEFLVVFGVLVVRHHVVFGERGDHRRIFDSFLEG